MRAAVIVEPHVLEITEVAQPSPAPGEVVVEVRACGICGTDIHILRGEYWGSYPRIPGHELSGVVTAVGAGVEHVREGMPVALNPNLPCRHCAQCLVGRPHLCEYNEAVGVSRDGGFAQLCAVPAELVVPLPEEVSYAQAALAEPLSCCIHGIDQAGIKTGDTVVILGGGSVGMMMTQLARLSGATGIIVSEPVAERRELVRSFGATAVIDPEKASDDLRKEVEEHTAGGADVIIEAAGLEATAQQAVGLARPGGTVLLFGVCPPQTKIHINPYDIFMHEITIKGSYINPSTLTRALALIASKAVTLDPLISHTLPLKGLLQGIKLMETGEAFKVIIDPQE